MTSSSNLNVNANDFQEFEIIQSLFTEQNQGKNGDQSQTNLLSLIATLQHLTEGSIEPQNDDATSAAPAFDQFSQENMEQRIQTILPRIRQLIGQIQSKNGGADELLKTLHQLPSSLSRHAEFAASENDSGSTNSSSNPEMSMNQFMRMSVSLESDLSVLQLLTGMDSKTTFDSSQDIGNALLNNAQSQLDQANSDVQQADKESTRHHILKIFGDIIGAIFVAVSWVVAPELAPITTLLYLGSVTGATQDIMQAAQSFLENTCGMSGTASKILTGVCFVVGAALAGAAGSEAVSMVRGGADVAEKVVTDTAKGVAKDLAVDEEGFIDTSSFPDEMEMTDLSSPKIEEDSLNVTKDTEKPKSFFEKLKEKNPFNGHPTAAAAALGGTSAMLQSQLLVELAQLMPKGVGRDVVELLALITELVMFIGVSVSSTMAVGEMGPKLSVGVMQTMFYGQLVGRLLQAANDGGMSINEFRQGNTQEHLSQHLELAQFQESLNDSQNQQMTQTYQWIGANVGSLTDALNNVTAAFIKEGESLMELKI